MPSQSDLHYSFQPLTGKASFEVVSFTLEEGLSTPFSLSLELVSDQDDVNFVELLDKPVLFTIARGLQPVRYVHGLISSLSQGDSGFYRTRYHALVEPQLARAGLRSNWRIFQQKTVPQILDSMLKAQGLTKVELDSCFDHQPREFCVQAGETDLDFIARLAAEEGFVYTFEHSATAHTLRLTDRLLSLGLISRAVIKTGDEDQAVASDDTPEALTVLYQPNSGGNQPAPGLRRFRYSEQVRTARQVQRDYTFTNPRYRQEHAVAASDLEHQSKDYERFDYPGRYKRDVVGKPLTQTRLHALRHDARIAEVSGDDERLQPGLSFNLVDHPRHDLNMHWRVMRVTHTGTQFSSLQEEAVGAQQGTEYEQQAVLIPGLAEWRPAPLPKPLIDGPHMATVVGPSGEEIYCDQWGRVKVSFPWDRESQDNEFSSCWVRVSQGWAGGSWGSMAIPRIGQEVIIQYVNADPDQPMIIGRTYCGNQLPPYDLPEHKTRMTIKSQTHKGDGFNELRFEDELGRQEVFIHAEKDQNNVVKHNETTFVGNDRSERVERHETVTIGGNNAETVALAKAETIGLAKALTIGAGYQVSVGAAMNTTVGLSQSEQVGIHKSVVVGNSFSITAGDEFSITVGKSSLVMRSDGTILLGGVEIEVNASADQRYTAKGEIILKAKNIKEN